MKEYKVENHVSSYLPDGNWKLVWADEFDGPELDRTKWDFRLNYWGKKAEAFTDEGIVFDGNSNIELHRVEKNGYYVSPHLQTGEMSFDVPKDQSDENVWKNTVWPLGELKPANFVHRFGYYECRCKLQKYPLDWWSAFWMQSPSIGTAYDPAWCGVENDIMEYQQLEEATTGNIYGGYASQFHHVGRVHYALKPTEDGYHTFGMHWTPTEYVFYCDGEIVSRSAAPVSQIPQFVLISTEVRGYRKGVPLKIGERVTKAKGLDIIQREMTDEGFVDDAFIVDYVRVFDEVEG
jgi:beta-glucanase (GH16 family)